MFVTVQIRMTVEKGERPTSPVHLHVDEDTPVHVHVKKPRKPQAGAIKSAEVIFVSSLMYVNNVMYRII